MKTPREKILEQIVRETFWMARRYAHGRHTYAPGIIREAYLSLKANGIDIKHDTVIKPPDEKCLGGFILRSDYLDDTNEQEDTNE